MKASNLEGIKMIVRRTGVVRGRSIELYSESGLPDGAEVTIQIESNGLSLEERRRRMQALCGAWRSDDSLEAVFDSIAVERQGRGHREVNLNDPS
jgi:hypothetical protein